MSKQYLIEKSDCIKYGASEIFDRNDAKEVEVLDIAEVSKELYVRTGISIASIPQIIDYLAANNLQIIKTVK